MTAQEQAHHRLLNAVITYIGADQNGSQQEIRDAVAELHASREESQKLLYPPQGHNPVKRQPKLSFLAKSGGNIIT